MKLNDLKTEDLSEEELKDFLDKNSQENQTADDDGFEPSANETTVKEEILLPSRKEKKKAVKKETKEESRLKKKKAKYIKKRRKALKKKRTTIVRYDTDKDSGLPKDLVEQRLNDGLINKTDDKKTKTIPQIILSNVITFFNILMFLIAGVLIYVRAYTDLVFLVIVVANILIGIVQEIKAKNMIDSLSLMSSPTANVIRDGIEKEIQIDEVVLDDLMVLSNGKQICADSIVQSGSIEVNESLLTGESDAIIKNPGDMLYSGSFVVAGKCTARVDKIGSDNYIEKLSDQAKVYKKPKSDLLNSLNLIIKVMSVPVIVFGVILFMIMYFREGGEYYRDLVNTVRKTAGAMIGMIPSGLFLMSSIALMVGVIRLGQRNVLVQELYCIEMLARVNCICLDKTGTITDGTMAVKNVIDYNTVSGLATRNIVSAMLNSIGDDNLTSKALKEKFGLGKRMKHTKIIPFSSQRKLQAVTFEKYGTFVLGAPEFVLKNSFNKYKKDVDKYASLGYRVLCLAHNDESISEDGELPVGEYLVLSMILIEDNIRPDAINTIRYFKESGVEVRVISGDNPITVSKIAQRAGIEMADKYISLDGLTDDEVIRAATKYTVFGRVSPKQKQILIHTLKESGRCVAMTGDGVNDILALREADCSIAVASGSEAARNCSHLVLLDSNFDSMPFVVSEGRRVINNVTKVSALFLTKTIFSLFLAIQAVITGTYPISTNQLFLIDTLAIGLPSLILVNEPNNNPVKGRFLYNVIKEALPGALTILLLSMIVFMLADQMFLSILTRNTIIIIAATHTCLMVLFKVCKPFNMLHKILCSVCYGLFVFAIIVIPNLLEIRPLLKISEYYSSTYINKQINKYPSVEISTSGYYVLDGSLSKISAKENDNNTTLYVVDGDSDIKEERKKIYYSFSPNSTKEDGSYDRTFRTDIVANIPEISYSSNGRIYLGGYYISNENLIYYDNIEKDLKADSNGKLYIERKNGEQITKKEYLKITLLKSDDYYDFKAKYGVLDENNVREASIMPNVVVENGEFIIDNVHPQGKKYKVPSSFDLSTGYDYSIREYTETERKDDYVLLADGNEIYATDNKTNKVSTEPYLIYLPTISTQIGDHPSLFLNAEYTGYNIFGIYGEKTINSVTGDYIYSLYDSSGQLVEYRTDESFMQNGDDITKTFFVKNIQEEGFKSLSVDGTSSTAIDVFDEYQTLDVCLTKNASTYNMFYSLVFYDYSTLEYVKNIDMLTMVNINSKKLKPTVQISESGYYVIDGYYTKYKAGEGNLNPLLTGDNYLVLNDIVTDYKLSNEYVTETQGGIVSILPLNCYILLIMLCLLSAPLMKIFQYSIPWSIEQTRNIKKGINKIGK